MFVGIGMNLVRGGTSASPASLFAGGEQGVWYDPSDLTTLFQDSAGITPVTAAGQTVGKMLDKSGRGNHATQSTSTQRPTYQVDGTGRPYLLFDGVDDGMVTGTITPNIDKVQVFAGVRKLLDGVSGIFLELGISGAGVDGYFNIQAPLSVGPYRFLSRGTVNATVSSASSYPAPITNTLTATADIANDVATIYVNGVQQNQTVTDQGTGNYLAYPLYIGRRGSGTVPFNGRIYSLIVRFGANLTAGQITSTESWVNGETGAY